MADDWPGSLDEIAERSLRRVSEPTEAAPTIEKGVMGWVLYEAPNLPTHRVPTWDIRGHALCPRTCPCQPRFDDESEMFVHNAFDGRERYEYGEAKRH